MLDVRDRPKFSGESARRMAQEVFGIQIDAKPLPSYGDQNFLLSRGGRSSWVLKIANRREEESVLALQNEALRYLERRDPLLPVPRILPALDGQMIATVDGTDGQYLVRLLTYLPGTPLAQSTPYTPRLLTELGRFLARLDKTLRGFDHPAARRPMLWSVYDAEQTVSANLSWLEDSEERAIVSRFLDSFRQHTLPSLSRLPAGIIHDDANDYNVLVQAGPDGLQSVVGLLDFGDVIWGPYAHEPAVAAAYVMQSVPDPLAAAGQLIGGYHAGFPLTKEGIAAIHDLICIRLCTTVVLAAKHAAQDPGRPYISVSEAGAWRVLKDLDKRDRNDVIDYYRTACGLGSSGAELEAGHTALLRRRQASIGPSLSLSYQEPLHIVRGFGQYLFSDSGRAYIDCVNNVAHVGHCHPAVVAAGQQQMAVLNTNTRYLGDNLVRYAERLTDILPEPLSVCYFVCSGSEANELALRLARSYTQRQSMIVLDGAYHGNTATLIDHSPYKHDGPGGQGTPGNVLKAPMPDSYRGVHRGEGAGERYATEVRATVDRLSDQGTAPAGIICEPLLGCGGQIVPPAGFLRQAFRHVRDAGGVCIADEVQVGFGRVGSHFWAFESQNVVPDIVTLGKPMGNGHPVAAVVTTQAIAGAFDNGMEYFNTFGGNPVSCAIGMAVLDVIQRESLQERAKQVGEVMQAGLRQLMDRYALIGDVRGLGLFIGVEIVGDRSMRVPAAKEAKKIVERMKDRGILLSTDGPDHNVIKIKPPLVISEADARFVVQQLGDVLSRL